MAGRPAFNRPTAGSIPPGSVRRLIISVWRSLVAHVPRAHGVEGSNPSTLTVDDRSICQRAEMKRAQVAERRLHQTVTLASLSGPRRFESFPAQSLTRETRRRFQGWNAGLQIRRGQVRSLHGVLFVEHFPSTWPIGQARDCNSRETGSIPVVLCVAVAQPVRAPRCERGSCGFDSRRSPCHLVNAFPPLPVRCRLRRPPHRSPCSTRAASSLNPEGSPPARRCWGARLFPTPA